MINRPNPDKTDYYESTSDQRIMSETENYKSTLYQWNKTLDSDPSDPNTYRSVFIPQMSIAQPELVVGDKWYVKIRDSLALSEVKITEVTEKTVLLYPLSHSPFKEVRYRKFDIEFIEKAEK